MMGQRTLHGVNHALFNTLRDAEEAEDGGDARFDFVDEVDGAQDESVQRKRRHRVGSKPPWLRHSMQELQDVQKDLTADRRDRRSS